MCFLLSLGKIKDIYKQKDLGDVYTEEAENKKKTNLSLNLQTELTGLNPHIRTILTS